MARSVAFRIGGEPPVGTSPEGRLLAKYPVLNRFASALLSALPPSSRLRRTLFSRGSRDAWAAVNRRDLTTYVRRFHTSDVLVEWPPGLVGHGERGRFEGQEEYLKVWASFFEAWSEVVLTPDLVLDLGGRMVQLANGTATGAAGGVPVRWDIGAVYRHRRGLIFHEHFLLDHDEALRAGGVDPAIRPELERLRPGGFMLLPENAVGPTP